VELLAGENASDYLQKPLMCINMQEPKQIALELNQLFEMLNRDKLLGPNMRRLLRNAFRNTNTVPVT